jgi:hypothetical protein
MGFSACDSRRYEYLLPSYCLLPPQSSDSLAKSLDTTSPGWRDTLGSAVEFADSAEEEVRVARQVGPRGESLKGGEGGGSMRLLYRDLENWSSNSRGPSKPSFSACDITLSNIKYKPDSTRSQ